MCRGVGGCVGWVDVQGCGCTGGCVCGSEAVSSQLALPTSGRSGKDIERSSCIS